MLVAVVAVQLRAIALRLRRLRHRLLRLRRLRHQVLRVAVNLDAMTATSAQQTAQAKNAQIILIVKVPKQGVTRMQDQYAV